MMIVWLTPSLYMPDLIHNSLGVEGTLVVLSWVILNTIFSGMCRETGWLFKCGLVTKVGSWCTFRTSGPLKCRKNHYMTCLCNIIIYSKLNVKTQDYQENTITFCGNII